MPIFERVAAELPVTLASTSYDLAEEDNCSEIQFQSSSAVTANLPEVVAVPNGFNVLLRNVGSGDLTIVPAGSEQIDGASSVVIG